jgi:hypothetical protein
LGANVRRSVSLRSHRTNPSGGSSFKQFGSPLRGGDSPKRKEDDEDDASSHFVDSQPQRHPRRKISLTTGLSRFRSTENLNNNRNTAIFLHIMHPHWVPDARQQRLSERNPASLGVMFLSPPPHHPQQPTRLQRPTL